jgi:hypothetical protein
LIDTRFSPPLPFPMVAAYLHHTKVTTPFFCRNTYLSDHLPKVADVAVYANLTQDCSAAQHFGDEIQKT